MGGVGSGQEIFVDQPENSGCVPFPPRNPERNSVEILRDLFGDGYYVCRFQEPGEMEEDFDSMDTEDIFKIFLSIRDPAPPIIPKEVGMRGYPIPDSLPCWLSQESLSYYATKFGKKGFTGGFNYFRALPLNWELTAPWSGSKVEVPSKFITGDLDITYNIPGVKEYIHKGGFENDVVGLEEIVVIEGAAHFVNQESPEEVTKQIHEFIQKY
ncbi:uncharacterized protein LOC111021100 [Momordica charantia]|uniref:Uncharacterized protein LOC111021100 n=1 Tax=Momordica charantia TaxID=3673 RepID=A0A6J1DI18_MOMCH|nr:uncharacterized protein LOC111021100 [Momordica charantia]